MRMTVLTRALPHHLLLDMIPVETIKKQFGINNIMRAIALVSEYLVLDENVQVNGYCGFEDMSNMSMSHIYNLYTKEVNEVWMSFYEVRHNLFGGLSA